MTLGIAGIVAAYILIGLLLLSINLYSRWAWQVKAAATILTSAFYVITYFSLPPLLGWPTTQSPPAQFLLVSTHVVQPDKETGADGAIYLWLTAIENMHRPAEPRAYRLEYSNTLHEKIIEAETRMEKDIAQIGEFKRPDDSFNRFEARKRGVKSADIDFYDLPEPLSPEK